MTIERNITPKIISLAKKFPVVTITGPRQSGKTTLIKNVFPGKEYFTLEDPDTRTLIMSDPRGFLELHKKGVVIDEAQLYPELFSYIQSHVDKHNLAGQVILSGSQNFLLLEKISQSLAGRTAVVNLLPFSIEELKDTRFFEKDVNGFILKGMYPRLYDKKIEPADFYQSYLHTYVERDVRQIKNITNLSLFIKFLKLCAGRTGQLINLNSLGVECGVSENTIRSWLSVLEASFIIYFLQPYHKNFNKRLVKTPKLYFWDTGLICSLLGITDKKQLSTHYMRGELFENFVMNDIHKYFYNRGHQPSCYFWRDKTGHEVDLMVESKGDTAAVEIKSGKTFHVDFLKGLKYISGLDKYDIKHSLLIMGSAPKINTAHTKIVGWDWLKDQKWG